MSQIKPKQNLNWKNLVTFVVNENQRENFTEQLEKNDITFRRAIVKLIAGFSRDIMKARRQIEYSESTRRK